MNRHHFHEKALYRAANAAILACVCLFTPTFGIIDVTWKNILVLFLVLVVLVGAGILPAKMRGICLLLMALCMGALVVAAGLQGTLLPAFLDFLRAYVRWCAGYGSGYVQWQDGFGLVQTVLITAASFLVQILTEKFRFVKFGLVCAFVAGMLICLFARISLTHLGVVFILFYVMVACVDWLQEHWKKTFWLSPFLAVYLLLMILMPAPDMPYDWQWAKDIYSRVRESFVKVSENIMHGREEDSDTSLSGFSGEGELGGDIREDEREVMYIRAQGDLVTNLYLTGRIYDTFDGREWQQENDDSDEDRFIDALETLYAVRRLDDKYQRDYIKETMISIQYRFFHTAYVFAPLKTRSIEGGKSDFDFSFEGGNLLLEERKGYGTEYDIVYYQLNAGGRLFGELLEGETPPDEALWEVISGEYERKTGQCVTLEMLELHRQAVYENYLTEVTLSEEAEQYLSEITENAGTGLERLRAIEQELSAYTYTRTPGALPDKITDESAFLDYFLLQSRQGYCTYFATAFVLLARAEGFPARYVQGFCVPVDKSGETVVLSSMAHSWPEVYIEGVGWIPFEPTPGYGRLRYTPWDVSARESVSDTPVIIWNEDEPEDVPITPEVVPKEQEAMDWSGVERIWRVSLFCVSTVLSGIVLVLILENLLGRYRYQRMKPAEKLRAEVQKNLWILSWLGLKREEQETLQELRERGIRMQGLTSLRFIEDYEDVLYGGKTAGEEMLNSAREERRQLWMLLRKEKKQTYIFYRLRMQHFYVFPVYINRNHKKSRREQG